MDIRKRRWLVLAAGCMVMGSLGFLYAWSSLSVPLSAEFDFSAWQASTVFTVQLWAFCAGGFVGAKVTRIAHARFTFACAAVLFLGAFLVPVFAAQGVLAWPSCLLYGLMGGCGIGMAYTIALDTVLPWFPRLTGVASGALLLCYGASTMLVSSAATALFDMAGWRVAFAIMAVSIAALVFGFSRALRLPSAVEAQALAKGATGDSPFGTGDADGLGGFGDVGGNGNGNGETEHADACVRDIPTSIMVRQPAFVFFALWVLILCCGNMGMVGAAHQVAVAAGTTDALAVTMVGVLSLCNGLGRIVNGVLFDRFGAVKAMRCVSLFLPLGSCLAIAGTLAGAEILLGLGLAVTGFGVGGSPVVSSGFVREEFGPAYYASNFSAANLMIAPGGLIGPAIMSASIEGAGSYLPALGIFVVLGFLALADTFVVARFVKRA